MANGTVKRLVTERGFGFVRDSATGEELFFHRSAIRFGTYEGLTEGQAVTFERQDSAKGPRAEDVRVA